MRIRALILIMIVLSVVGYLRSSAPAHANRLQNVPTPSSTPDLVMTQVRKANTLTKADTAYMRAGDLTTPSLIPLDNIMQVAAGASGGGGAAASPPSLCSPPVPRHRLATARAREGRACCLKKQRA